MRADRLVSLVLLLRQRGRLTADTLARELAAGLSAEEQTEARRRRDAWLAEIGE